MHDHATLKPGTEEYLRHLKEEVEHYAHIYDDDGAKLTLTQPTPPSWKEVERRCLDRVSSATGDVPLGHVSAHLNDRPDARLLSLGCGPGGIELQIARQHRGARITGLDVNDDLLAMGSERAVSEGLAVTFEHADLNTLTLPASTYDVVWCHAALHHVIELERVADQIKKTLRPGGILAVVDVTAPNGYGFWPGVREVARALFEIMPERFRVNHTAYADPRLDAELWEATTAGMECIRSEDILPVLGERFETRHYVPYFALARRFLDNMYGTNLDLSRPLDRAWFDFVWELDMDYLARGALRAETFFGVYTPR